MYTQKARNHRALLLPYSTCEDWEGLCRRTSIGTTLELNQSPRVTNVFIFQDHFTKHVLAYVTPDQTAKTVTKFLYGGYISIFGAPARLLSDRGTSFASSIIEELCRILGIQQLQTMPYHPQTNMGWLRDHTR